MSGSDKLRARQRVVEAQRRANEKRASLALANADDAASVRVLLQRLGAVDVWESARLDQVTENVRKDAARKRVSHFVNLQSVIGRMRDRGQTVASIANLAEVGARDLQNVLRRARADDGGVQRAARSRDGSGLAANRAVSRSNSTVDVDHWSTGADCDSTFDPSRCVRCDAVMLDPDVTSRRGRPRRYCSDTCRRDASAARTAAERHGEPIRLVEVSRAAGRSERHAQHDCAPAAEIRSARDAVDLALNNADVMNILLSSVLSRARRKELDRSTFEIVRELARAVYPNRQ